MTMLRLLVCSAIAWAWPAFAGTNDGADILIRNVRPVGTHTRPATSASFVIRRGQIVFIGSESRALGFLGPETQILDGGNCFISPGLHDAHTHLMWSALDRHEVRLTGVRTKQEVLRTLVSHLKTIPTTQWMIGAGLPASFDSREFSSKLLNSVSETRPVIVSFGDGHRVAINTAAKLLLEKEMRKSNAPVGSLPDVLSEQAAFHAMEVARRSVITDKRSLFLSRLRHAATLGITSIHEFGSFEDLQILNDMDKQDELPIRIKYSLPADTNVADVEKIRDELARNGRKLRLGSVKLFLDGSLSARTAALSHPYSDQKSHFGVLLYDEERLKNLLTTLSDRNIPISMHAIGDAAVHQALVALQTFGPDKAARLGITIEHAELISEADLDLLRKSGVTVSMQPSQLIDDQQILEKRVGSTRLGWAFRWSQISDLGVPVIFGSDFPFGNLSPWKGIRVLTSREDGTSATRQLPMGRIFRGYAMGAELQSWSNAALLKPADLLILDRDFTAGRSRLDPRILAVLVDGRFAIAPKRCSCPEP